VKKEEEEVTQAERVAVVRAAVRWAKNMLVEVLGNHSKHLSPGEREPIKRAIEALGEFR